MCAGRRGCGGRAATRRVPRKTVACGRVVVDSSSSAPSSCNHGARARAPLRAARAAPSCPSTKLSMHQNLTFSARAWLALAVVACGSAEQARDALGFNEPSPTLPDAEDPARFVDNEAAYLPAAEGAEEC